MLDKVREGGEFESCEELTHGDTSPEKQTKRGDYVTVLELPPVDSPESAVKVAVASEIKDAREKTKGR